MQRFIQICAALFLFLLPGQYVYATEDHCKVADNWATACKGGRCRFVQRVIFSNVNLQATADIWSVSGEDGQLQHLWLELQVDYPGIDKNAPISVNLSEDYVGSWEPPSCRGVPCGGFITESWDTFRQSEELVLLVPKSPDSSNVLGSYYVTRFDITGVVCAINEQLLARQHK